MNRKRKGGYIVTIKEVSEKYGLSIDTLRYYEKIGLLPTIKRNAKGHREYSETDCNWVYYMKQMRQAGVSIEALVEYVSLYREGPETMQLRKTILLEQRDQIMKKAKEIQETLSLLEHKLDVYEERILKFEEERLK